MMQVVGPIKYFPPAGFEPFLPPYVPPSPRGRWVWIPDYGPEYPTPYAPTWFGVDPAFERDFTLVRITHETSVTGALTIG